MLPTLPRWMRLAAWCHRQCLRLASLRFRQQFASDTDDAFAQFVDETRRTRGTARGVLGAVAGILDAASAAMRERGADASQALAGGLWTDIARALASIGARQSSLRPLRSSWQLLRVR